MRQSINAEHGQGTEKLYALHILTSTLSATTLNILVMPQSLADR